MVKKSSGTGTRTPQCNFVVDEMETRGDGCCGCNDKDCLVECLWEGANASTSTVTNAMEQAHKQATRTLQLKTAILQMMMFVCLIMCSKCGVSE